MWFLVKLLLWGFQGQRLQYLFSSLSDTLTLNNEHIGSWIEKVSKRLQTKKRKKKIKCENRRPCVMSEYEPIFRSHTLQLQKWRHIESMILCQRRLQWHLVARVVDFSQLNPERIDNLILNYMLTSVGSIPNCSVFYEGPILKWWLNLVLDKSTGKLATVANRLLRRTGSSGQIPRRKLVKTTGTTVCSAQRGAWSTVPMSDISNLGIKVCDCLQRIYWQLA